MKSRASPKVSKSAHRVLFKLLMSAVTSLKGFGLSSRSKISLIKIKD